MTAQKLTGEVKEFGPTKIRLYEQMGPLSQDMKKARHLGKNLGAKKLCSIFPTQETRHQVVQHEHTDVLCGEGVVLNEAGQGVIFSSTDSPVVIAVNQETGAVGVAYAGKDSLMKVKPDCPSCDTGILENLFAAIGNPFAENLLVHVAGGIPTNYISYEPHVVQPFVDKFGPSVAPDPLKSNLDLLRVVRKICITRGLKYQDVTSDGRSSYDARWNGNVRAYKETPHWLYVIRCR